MEPKRRGELARKMCNSFHLQTSCGCSVNFYIKEGCYCCCCCFHSPPPCFVVVVLRVFFVVVVVVVVCLFVCLLWVFFLCFCFCLLQI